MPRAAPGALGTAASIPTSFVLRSASLAEPLPAVASVLSDDAALFGVGDLRGTFRLVVAPAEDEVVLVSPWVTS